MTAPLPPRIVERGLVSDQVVVNTVVAKYVEHMPLHRQSAKLAREAGLAISRATLDGWVMRVGELLTPVTAPALLAELRCQIEQTRGEALPASALGRAAAHGLAEWPKLVRFLDYPELELSNNLAGNAIRPVALGRKNWLQLGSAEAGPKIAAILSVVETCRRLGIELRAYLMDVLPRLADTSIQEVPELRPAAWAGQRR